MTPFISLLHRLLLLRVRVRVFLLFAHPIGAQATVINLSYNQIDDCLQQNIETDFDLFRF